MNKEQQEECPPDFVCDDCGEVCQIEEECFEYAGTHCNNGSSGFHKTGALVSSCCEADYS